MSISKYMQIYRDKGFFLGSIIRVNVTDRAFLSQQLILSKGNEVLDSKTILGEKTDFFTDESGTLTITCDNGTSVIAGNVNVTAYGTYNVTLASINSDGSRDIFPDTTDVLLFVGDTSKNVRFAYTGDKANTSVVSSDTTVATATIQDNVVTISKASGDTEATCTVTATVGASGEYDSKSVNFNVKRYGSIGDWANASDETIVNMVAAADRGEINLRDYWNVGDVRTVHLNNISKDSGSIVLAQPEQTIQLVLMHDSISDAKYTLTTPTESRRTRPSFIVGQKNCLQNLSPLDFVSETKSITAGTYITTFEHKTMSIDSWLNTKYFNALPEILRQIFKKVEVRYIKGEMKLIDASTPSAKITNYGNALKTKSQKICLPSVYEIFGKGMEFDSSYAFRVSTKNNDARGIMYQLGSYSNVGNHVGLTLDISQEGSPLTYYNSYKPTPSYNTYFNTHKTRGTNERVGYYTRSELDMATVWKYASSGNYGMSTIRGIGVRKNTDQQYWSSSELTNFDKDNYTSMYYGISPMMFI